MELLIPISPGELLDKLTILEIKLERMDNEAQLANVQREYDLLSEVWERSGSREPSIAQLRADLRKVNETVWVIEDDIRVEGSHERYGERFTALARQFTDGNQAAGGVQHLINHE